MASPDLHFQRQVQATQQKMAQLAREENELAQRERAVLQTLENGAENHRHLTKTTYDTRKTQNNQAKLAELTSHGQNRDNAPAEHANKKCEATGKSLDITLWKTTGAKHCQDQPDVVYTPDHNVQRTFDCHRKGMIYHAQTHKCVTPARFCKLERALNGHKTFSNKDIPIPGPVRTGEQVNIPVKAGPAILYNPHSDRQKRAAAKEKGWVYYKQWDPKTKEYKVITGRPRKVSHHQHFVHLLNEERRRILIAANFKPLQKENKHGKKVWKYPKLTEAETAALFDAMTKTPLWNEVHTDPEIQKAHESAKEFFSIHHNPARKAALKEHNKAVKEHLFQTILAQEAKFNTVSPALQRKLPKTMRLKVRCPDEGECLPHDQLPHDHPHRRHYNNESKYKVNLDLRKANVTHQDIAEAFSRHAPHGKGYSPPVAHKHVHPTTPHTTPGAQHPVHDYMDEGEGLEYQGANTFGTPPTGSRAGSNFVGSPPSSPTLSASGSEGYASKPPTPLSAPSEQAMMGLTRGPQTQPQTNPDDLARAIAIANTPGRYVPPQDN